MSDEKQEQELLICEGCRGRFIDSDLHYFYDYGDTEEMANSFCGKCCIPDNADFHGADSE